MNATIAWPAPAKINLFLHVVGQRSDGYHRLQTVFQFLDYSDTLRFTPRADGRVQRVAGNPAITADSDLCVRAARLLQTATGSTRGVDIALEKRIPVGAGLGGGSSDAATTLVALNRLWGCGLPVHDLAALGLQLGADVPVFVRGHAAWGEGVGEELRPVSPPELWFAVLTPPVHVATATVFADSALCRNHPPVNWDDFLHGRTGNDCTPVTRRLFPPVATALDWLGQRAPARMSGTGCAVFAAFTDSAAAHAAVHDAPREWRAFVAKAMNVSPLMAASRL